MSSEVVNVEWVSDRVFLLRDQHDFPVVMTQPMGVKGADLLPLSLIGCGAWDVMDILRKQRQQVTGLHVSAESEREDEMPWRFKKITVTYRLTGNNLDPKLVAQAVALGGEKYCSIHATLSASVEIVNLFEIVEAE